MKTFLLTSAIFVACSAGAAPVNKTVAPKLPPLKSVPTESIPPLPGSTEPLPLPPPLGINEDAFPHFMFHVVVEKRVPGDTSEKKPFSAEMSMMLGAPMNIQNTNTLSYLDGKNVATVDEQEGLLVESLILPNTKPTEDGLHCFQISYRSQTVNFVILSPEQRRPMIGKQSFEDAVCLKLGETVVLNKNLRLFPAEWKFTLDRVTRIPKSVNLGTTTVIRDTRDVFPLNNEKSQ